MLKLAPKHIQLKPFPRFNVPAFVSSDHRKFILQRTLDRYPKLQIKGGTTKTNPYKLHYEILLAEKRTQLAYYENSVLWSPRYTPTHFKYLFLYPFTLVILFLVYLRYIGMPKRMLFLRKKYGFKFPELEEKGWLNGWIDDEIADELVYEDYTLKDLADYDKLSTDQKLTTKERASHVRQKNLHYDMQSKFRQIYTTREEIGKPTA